MNLDALALLLLCAANLTCTFGDQSNALIGTESIPVEFELVLRAIKNALQFLTANIDRINIDGVIGILEIEGRTRVILERYRDKMPASVITKLNEIQQSASRAAELGKATTNKTTPYYYSRIGALLEKHFGDVYYTPKLLDHNVKWHLPDSFDTWTEKSSDDCLREFLNKTSTGTCVISNKCWQIANSDKQTGYSLTHQVFYFLNGIQAGCYADLQRLSFGTPPYDSILQRLQRYCSRIFAETNNIAGEGYPAEYRDLFMEQIGMCGGAGFLEFAQPDWLAYILSWQAENGCYYKFPDELIDPRNFALHVYGSYRRKRAEAYMSDENACLSHRTGVALSALNTYMTMYIEQLYGSLNFS